MFSWLSFTRRKTKESRHGAGTEFPSEWTGSVFKSVYKPCVLKQDQIRTPYLLWACQLSGGWGACGSVPQTSSGFLCLQHTWTMQAYTYGNSKHTTENRILGPTKTYTHVKSKLTTKTEYSGQHKPCWDAERRHKKRRRVLLPGSETGRGGNNWKVVKMIKSRSTEIFSIPHVV